MWRVALAGIVVWGIAGCVSDHGSGTIDTGVVVRSCADLDAMHPTYPYWTLNSLACEGTWFCPGGGIPCRCDGGHVLCTPGLIDANQQYDSSASDTSTADASHDAGTDAGPCAPHPPPSGTGCHTSAECNATNFEMCYAPGASQGCPVCVPPTRQCASDADCASTAYCNQYVNPCTPASGFCNPSGDRTSTECVPRCTATSCGDGFTCLSTGRCSAISCMNGYTCPTHMHCGDLAGGDEHGCFRDSCSFDADCGCGAACLMGYCYDTLGACMPPAA
jgi:hypothetical protein